MPGKIIGCINKSGMIRSNIYNSALSCITSYVNFKDKRILVTGATGLIGSCIIDLLLFVNKKEERNNHIYALGRNAQKIKNRFEEFSSDKCFHLIEQDICQKISNDVEFDYIIHGASNADPIAYAKYPVETMQTTLLGAINILEYGRLHRDCKIVMLSTFEVYGNANHDIYNEQDIGIIDFNVLRASYPESKRSMEILSRCYVDEYGVHVNIARLCSVYGPTMLATDSKAHAQFIRKALHKEDIVLKSKGEQRRSYCHVIDAVSGIFTILMRGEKGGCYNVCDDKSIISIAGVAHAIAHIVGVSVVFAQPSALEAKGYSKPQDIILDNSKLRSLGWCPMFSLHEGLKMTLKVLEEQ